MEVKCRNCDKSLPEVGTRSHCSSEGRWPGIRVWIVSFVTSVCFHQGKILVLLLVLRLLSQFSLRVSISPSLRKLLVGLKNVPQETSGWFPKKRSHRELDAQPLPGDRLWSVRLQSPVVPVRVGEARVVDRALDRLLP